MPDSKALSDFLDRLRPAPASVLLLDYDGTLAPFNGHFVIHGARPNVREGVWRGDLIAIAFPDLDTARAWYESDAYRQIQPLRARHASGPLILIDGVDARHKATDILR